MKSITRLRSQLSLIRRKCEGFLIVTAVLIIVSFASIVTIFPKLNSLNWLTIVLIIVFLSYPVMTIALTRRAAIVTAQLAQNASDIGTTVEGELMKLVGTPNRIIFFNSLFQPFHNKPESLWNFVYIFGDLGKVMIMSAPIDTLLRGLLAGGDVPVTGKFLLGQFEKNR